MDQYLDWEQLTLIQQLNCVCDTLAKLAITTATLHGYHIRQFHLLPKEDVALIIWGKKVTGDICPLSDSMPAKRLRVNTWECAGRISGLTISSMQLTGSTWTWSLRIIPTCTRFRGLSKIKDSAAQGSKLAASLATSARMNDVQNAVAGKQQCISCSVLMKIVQNY